MVLLLVAVLAFAIFAAAVFLALTRGSQGRALSLQTGAFLSPCTSVPCAVGLVCDAASNTCLRAPGDACVSAFDCADGATCAGVCVASTAGMLDDPCPCTAGYLCVAAQGLQNCKVAPGFSCGAPGDCANGYCVNGFCASGYPDGTLGCTVGGECASGSCVSGACSNGVPYGVAGAPCGGACVDYPTTECNPGLECDCQLGPDIPGLCTLKNVGLLLPCNSVNLCASSLVCQDEACVYPDAPLFPGPCSTASASCVAKPTVLRFDYVGAPYLLGSTSMSAVEAAPDPPAPRAFCATAAGVLYILSQDGLYNYRSSRGWANVLPGDFQLLAVAGEDAYVYSAATGVISKAGSATFSVAVNISPIDSFAINSAGDILVTSSGKMYRKAKSSSSFSGGLVLYSPGDNGTTLSRSVDGLGPSQAQFYPSGAAPYVPSESACFQTQQCQPQANYAFLSDSGQAVFAGNYAGFATPEDALQWSVSPGAASDGSYTFAMITKSLRLYVSNANLGTVVPYDVPAGALVAASASNAYMYTPFVSYETD